MLAFESIRIWYQNERRELLVSFATSLTVHIVVLAAWILFGLYTLGLHRMAVEAVEEDLLAARQEPPLLFVEVMPEQAVEEVPEEAKHYSYANARAANPDAEIDSNQPKVVGEQEILPKTEEEAPSPAESLQPTPEEEPTPELVPEEPKPREPDPVGDLAMVNPEPKPIFRSRPRTLVEARLRRGITRARKMNQEGGVRRRGTVSLDVKSTPFGAYDREVINAIQERWYQLLDESAFVTRTGRVILEFRMHRDGRITDMEVIKQDVGEVLTLYCRRAISDPAPYAEWSPDMIRIIGKDYREVKFTFYYL